MLNLLTVLYHSILNSKTLQADFKNDKKSAIILSVCEYFTPFFRKKWDNFGFLWTSFLYL